MGIEFKKTKIPGNFPVFWRGEFKVLPGDFRIKQTLPEGTLLKRGTPLQLDFDKMECGICKVAKVIAGGTTTAPRVQKGSLIQVGDTVAKIGKLDLSRTVNGIDKSNDEFDIITLNGAMTTLTAGDFITESAAYVADPLTESAPLYTPNAVIETTKEYSPTKGFQTVSAGYEGLILKEIAYPVPESWLTGFSMKNNPSIKYIKQ